MALPPGTLQHFWLAEANRASFIIVGSLSRRHNQTLVRVEGSIGLEFR